MRIAFICHPNSGRAWSPTDAERGIGGSEEAVIHLSAALARRGHWVSVHMRAGRHAFVRGVHWGNWDTLPHDHVDVAVVWRRPSLVRHVDDWIEHIGARYLWLHDNNRPAAVYDQMHHYDKVIVLSASHRRRFPEIPDEQAWISSNGIDPAQFDAPHPWRDPALVVYGSDYQRGLRDLLTSWPIIRAAVPRARLHVFYGWQGVEQRNPARAEQLKATFAPLLGQPGVTHLGRVGHAAVADEYRRAGVWAYPCSFSETNCITAMKAQAGGAVPAIIPTGALRETVRFGFRTDSDQPQSADVLAQWLAGLIDLLRSPERQRLVRREMMPWARRTFAWDGVAAQWEHGFRAGSRK